MADPDSCSPDVISDIPSRLDSQLVLACEQGNLDRVRSLVEEGADICYQDPKTGISVLMVAASAGHSEVVRFLLEEGAPWNAVDRAYMCAGDYAAKHGQQECIDLLMDHAVMSEMLLSLAMRNRGSEQDSSVLTNTTVQAVPAESLNASYLSSRLEYTDDGQRLVDRSTQLAVMMDWERPLMARHAAWICHTDSRTPDSHIRVLNVGFGMGIVDEEIQKHKPLSHVIIEAHDEVLMKMELDGWTSRKGLAVLKGRWQDVVPVLSREIKEGTSLPFDGIFFDTYAEDDLDLNDFQSWLPELLRSPGGRYSYYNGVCPDNVFFHGVACETIRLHLNRLNIDCQFEPIPVDVSDAELWKDLSRRYWHFDTYFLPKCTLRYPDKSVV